MFIYLLFIYYTVYTHVKLFTIVKNRKYPNPNHNPSLRAH